MFFFTSYEGFRQVAPTVSTTRVPTAAERATVTDPISLSLLQFWPAPNFTPTSGANNFIANVGSTTFDETGLAKVDYNFSEKIISAGGGLNIEALPLRPAPFRCWAATAMRP